MYYKSLALLVFNHFLFCMDIRKEHRGVLRWAFLAGLGTLGSRIVGLFREAFMAALFGTGMVADAFSAAFRFPNLLRRVFGESGLLVVLLPRYSQERIELGDDEAFVLASSVATMLGFVIGIVIIIGELTAPYLAWVFAHGWVNQPEKFQLTVQLLRVLYPFIGFIAYASWASAILNAHKKFFLPSLAPAFMNLGWLLGAMLAMWVFASPNPRLQAIVVASGVLLGGFLQFAVQYAMMRSIGYRFKATIRQKIPAVLEIGKLLLPALAALAVLEINFLVDIFLASFLPEGSVSALTYANRLVYLPLGLASVAMARATLPAISDLAVHARFDKFRSMIAFSTKVILGLMLPITAYIIALDNEIVSFLFERGSFSGTVSTPITAFALSLYAIGLFAFGTNKILMQGFYALKDTKTPMKLSALVVAINITLNLLLIGPLKHGGLALATSLSSIVHVVLLSVVLSRRGKHKFAPHFKSFLRVTAAALIIGALTKFASMGTNAVIIGNSFIDRLLQLGLPSIVWVITLIIVAKIGKVGEIEQFFILFMERIKGILAKDRKHLKHK